MTSLQSVQLDEYPLGLVKCPNPRVDPIAQQTWRGNDRMILGYMRSHMQASETQVIAHCNTSAEAYDMLRTRHEKRSGLTQIQLIQRMMQIRFDNNPNTFDTTMTHLRDLIYRAEQIGQVDISKLAILFILVHLKGTHPSVYEALSPSLMEGTVTLEAFERRMYHFYEAEATHNPDHLAFPSLSPILDTFPSHTSSVHSSPSSPITALPASLPPRANICPNCKKAGHSIEFCIAPGGKMEGQSALDAVARQRAIREASRSSRQPPIGTPSNSNPLVKIDSDGTVWIGGVKYQPASPPEPEKASIAEADIEAAMTAADKGEYVEWASSNCDPNWNKDGFIDTATFLLADTNKSLANNDEPPLYLDSGASTHISCIRSDFSEFRPIEPRTIMGVGNSSVAATGLGTIEITIHETSARLTLRNVLYAQKAGVRLISISRLDDSGYKLSFADGICTVLEHSSGRTLARCSRNSSNLYVFPGSIRSHSSSIPSFPFSFPCTAFPSLTAKPNLETWHRRLGHANFRTVLDMARGDVTAGMQVDLSLAPQACDACIRGKQTHSAVPKIREGPKADRPLGRVFVDLSGPQSVTSRSGFCYIMNIIDDFSGYHWTRLLKAKSEAARVMRDWLLAAETQSHKKLCYFVTDNGELRSNEILQWCAERGITHQFTAPHTSAQNGRVERLHRTLMNKARAMRLSCNAPLHMWDEFILTASYLSTLTASKAANGRTPYELWFGRRPSLTHLCEIGSRAYVFTTGTNPKIAARSIEFTLIGYASNAKAYRCWHRESGRIIDSFHVTFVEHLNDQPRSFQPSTDTIAEPNVEEGVTAPSDTEGTAEPPASTHAGEDKLPRRSARNRVPAPSKAIANDGLAFGGATARALEQVREAASRRAAAKVDAKEPPTIACAVEEDDLADTREDPSSEEPIPEIILLVDVEDPDAPTWTEALQSSDHDKWIEGAEAELTGLRDMGVYALVPRSEVPTNRSVLRGRFVCRLKRDEIGNPVHFKVRWVAKGFQQVWGRDFSKTTSPTARLESLRVVLHMAATLNWHLEQYDVKTAFLNGILPEEEVQYMEQPPGFVQPGSESHVWKLLRGLYGMRQSSRIWNRALHSSFLSWGFSRSECEWCVYTRRSDNGDASIVVVHVDDMLAASSNKTEANRFRSELEATWQITALGEPKLVVGIALQREVETKTIRLSQTALIDKVVSIYRQSDAKPATSPMAHGTQLLRPHPNEQLDDVERERLANIPYRSLVGSLMYIASGTRPDIAFAVGKLSRFLDCYREAHWQAAVRVVRYLKDTRMFSLRLGGTSSSLIGYCDSDYANDPGAEGRRSVAGYCFSLGDGMVSWSSKKQKTIADSTCAAEYMAASEAGRELVWLRTLLRELNFEQSHATPLLCDNSAAVLLCGDQAFHNRVKHLDVKYHWIRERVEKEEMVVGRIPTSGNVADILTKALPGPRFVTLRGCLGVIQRATDVRAEGECKNPK